MNSLARGSIILIAGMAVNTMLNYAFTVGVGWLLGPEDYGVFGVAMSFLLILGFLVQSGFAPTVAKFLSEGRDSPSGILKTALLGNVILGVAIAAIFWSISRALGLGEEYSGIIPLLLSAVMVAAVGTVAYGALQGMFRFGRMAIYHIVDATAKVALGLALILLGYGALGAISGVVGGILLGMILCLFWIRDTKFWRGREFTSPGVFKTALPMLTGTLALTMLMNIDILGIKLLTTSNQYAGYYQAAITLGRIPAWIIVGVMGAAFPFIAKHARSQLSEIYVSTLLRYTFLFLIPVSLAFMAAPRPLLGLFYPAEYLPAAGALALVSLGMIFLVLTNVLARGYQATGQLKVPGVFLPLAVAVQIGLMLWLTPRYGLTGTALATTIACFTGLVPHLRGKFRRLLGESFDRRIIISYAILVVLPYFYPWYHGRGLTVAAIGLAAAAYLVSLKLLGLFSQADAATIVYGIFAADSIVARAILGVINLGGLLDRFERRDDSPQ